MTARSTPARSVCAASRRGFSIVECAIAMVIVGVALVAAVNTVGAARRGEAGLIDSRRAMVLAQDLVAEIGAQPYTDANDTATVFGPTAAESAPGNRSLYNDVNDYRNRSESPPTAKDGSSLGLDSTWRRSVQVDFVSPTDPNVASATDQGLARITVKVSRKSVPLASLSTLRSAGLPATEMCTLSDGTKLNLAPAHCMALGGTSAGPGTNAWTIAEPPDVVTGVGLVAHWKMDESSGTTVADSKGSNNGTLTNGPTWVAGRFGNALRFDGSNDHVMVSHHSALSLTNTLTLAAWIRLDFIPADSEYLTIVHKGQSSTNRNYFLRVTDGMLSFGFIDTGGTTRRYTGGALSATNTWYHVAATFDDATNRVVLYINGASAYSATVTPVPAANTGALSIGKTYNNYDFFDGRIDDARIYGRVLSAAEIATLFNGGEP